MDDVTENAFNNRCHILLMEHLDFMRHLFASRETGCTVDFEIETTIRFDKAILVQKGG